MQPNSRSLQLNPRVTVYRDPSHELLTHQAERVLVAEASTGIKYILGISSFVGKEGPLGGYFQHVTRDRAKEVIKESKRKKIEG